MFGPFDMLMGFVCGVAARGLGVCQKWCMDALYKLYVLVVSVSLFHKLTVWALLVVGATGDNRPEDWDWDKRRVPESESRGVVDDDP
ncbi:hypothetical protein ACOMHN_043972 [Nucella lapillus]